MSDGKEYLYWHDAEGVLQYHVGNFYQTMDKCSELQGMLLYCYGEDYQFDSPWYFLDPSYYVKGHINPNAVPRDIQLLHMLIYRG